MSHVKIKIGADPELFLRKKDTGVFVSAHDLLPGTKEEPFPVPRGAIQVDGAAAEVNIEPADNSETFVRNINEVMKNLHSRVEGYQIVPLPAITFEPTYFKSLPASVKELGCNPDYNAWTGQINPRPDGEATTMRTASGHIHIGWTNNVDPNNKDHFEDCRIAAKQLDYFLGLPSLMWDQDPTRRQLYGKAGAFRPKPYGMEYRVLSNAWLCTRDMQYWVYHAAEQAIRTLLSSSSLEDKYGSYAQEAINNNTLDWWKTTEGKKIFRDTRLSWPPYGDVLSRQKALLAPPKQQVSESALQKAVYKKVAGYKYNKLILD